MKSLWDDQEANQYQGDLPQRVYTSRLLGREPSLVLHGGGNTSVKCQVTNLVGEKEDILYVKGSGWDLATIEAAGFAPVRMPHLLKLSKLTQLSDRQMVNELKTQMTLASAPSPSVETILHAILPFKYVDHTHADAVVTITNTANGEERIREIYGDHLVIIPYVMPGFDLARVCAEKFAAEAHGGTVGMVLMNHGIFSFGAIAREAYEGMISLVNEAEEYLKNQGVWQISYGQPQKSTTENRLALAQLRCDASKIAGFPLVMRQYQDEASLSFSQRPDLAHISQQGPATPDHVIRTKRLPQLGRDVADYAKKYQEYFQRNDGKSGEVKTMLDPAPRIILDRELGLLTLGTSAKSTAIAGDIYQHTMAIIQRAKGLGGYQALPESDIFVVEYWDLEQAKLKQAGNPPMFAGEVALVTGGASGIGKASVAQLLKQGAAVIALDIQPNISELHNRPDFLGIQCDLTDANAFKQALEQGIAQFGGLDMLVLNAGIFPVARAIAELSTLEWQKVLNINLDANLTLLRECYPLLKLAPKGGRVVVIGSKNVTAPGPGLAAYSASKAALNQLMRVASLEWAKDNIRLNTIHPNGVFDTGFWTEEVLEARAKHYGLTVEEYKGNNLLKVEVTSQDVAELVTAMASPLFGKITGAQLPLDGGNDRVI
ncbi:short-chain alcohol dehydrogenase family [Synechocystis sp. PCC 6803]|uniref:Short-chain alcohol dehydrogenase family n=1 Tax=Synechocystis sp. (strain ATCC 27184 / PCC 6803 / Kazusa) TaxID=1111708 RepID=P73359_SYNY3|nr:MULTISPECIES: bifunctional aldolase/short-chain dehydrogenase [unclassified Synechocystis]BAM51115.1 short chain dehydrogenase [Synechocystis sp. PCC 6803] [Bacillus subtilis BEST7613]AGF51079.1 short-chain alcohol dehydrogenase family [Synechocystis sp. PCC 6803]ALJ67110.1 short-chain dehydrogenase [Synechocystis sp. PCC 6803]AVP88952.1 bifunctional aldolase/short-chain dehydrogenase [Synechocystis sp. IPPAS B-1465]MBD2618617.1 bifunctional aldolase/short-chain dehydrogenase [Synechocystis